MGQGIRFGERFLCIKTVKMKKDKTDIRYIKGKEYVSQLSGAITDEKGNVSHYWNDAKSEYFTKVGDSVVSVGEKFVCIKTVIENKGGHHHSEVYSKGFIYLSEEEGCITNNLGQMHHGWDNPKKNFIKILTEI
jgi:hypothetical protein